MTPPPAPTVRTGPVALLLVLAAALSATPRAVAQPPKPGSATVFVGTYTGGESRGVYRFELDLTTGKPSEAALAVETPSPSFLAVHPTRRFLYAVNEVNTFQGQPTGSVSAFAVDPKSGRLTALNAASSGGTGPCHLVVDKAGQNVLVANYGGGSTAVLPVASDGRLGAPSSVVRHTGSSVNKSRQSEPHAHSVNLDAAGRFAFVADLGLDKILIYRFDPSRGAIAPNDPPAAALAPGSGPRHFAFHPNGRFAYVINELSSTVTAWTYDPGRGALTELQTVSTLPAGVKGGNYPAEVQVHPSGKFVYGSNRGHDSIAAFRVDPEGGKLSPVGHQGQGVKNPRNFAVDPTGTFLLVANQDADTVVVFRVDPGSGNLAATGHVVKAPKPVCLKFWTPVE